MRRIAELHLLYSSAGSRMLHNLLRRQGVGIGQLHVAALMKRMRIKAIYHRSNTLKPAPRHKVYPGLLRKLAMTRRNEFRLQTPLSCPWARGFVNLVTVVYINP